MLLQHPRDQREIIFQVAWNLFQPLEETKSKRKSKYAEKLQITWHFHGLRQRSNQSKWGQEKIVFSVNAISLSYENSTNKTLLKKRWVSRIFISKSIMNIWFSKTNRSLFLKLKRFSIFWLNNIILPYSFKRRLQIKKQPFIFMLFY